MPAPAVVAAGISAGAGLLGTGIDALSTINQNKQSRRHQIYMYDRQRADALADWQMQNEYNSPREVMKRYRDANLNANLIYGNGTLAQADAVRSSSPGSWSPEPVKSNLGITANNAIAAYQDTRMKDAQIDLVHEQTKATAQEALLKAAATIATQIKTVGYGTDNKTKEFQLQQADRLKDLVFDQSTNNLRKTTAEAEFLEQTLGTRVDYTKGTLQTQILDQLLKKANAQESKTRRQEMLQRIDNMKKDGTIKDLDIKLKRLGVQPGDELWQRVLAQALGYMAE